MSGAMGEKLRAARTTGFLQERLWVILLPALLLASLIGASWASLIMRGNERAREIAVIERRLQRAVHAVATDVGHALQQGNRERYTFLIDALAQVTNGRVELHGDRRALLVMREPAGRAQQEAGTGSKVSGDGEIFVWGPAKDVGGHKVGEIRLHVPLPVAQPFPWRVWSNLLSVFALISAVILLLVTRVLAPLRHLAGVFRDVGNKPPAAVRLPMERLAEFGQLRDELEQCLAGLQQRQLRAEESFVEVAYGLAREYEYHREGHVGHGQRTRRYASWIADRLRLPPKERDALEVASLCHDIGKLPADEAGLGNDADATSEHAAAGAAFFDAMPGLEDVARIIAAHHENWDGSGHPGAATGEEIPIGARIVRIADAFDRFYTESDSGTTLEDSLMELDEGKGTLFDPYLVEFFREEVELHMRERRRLRVTLQAAGAPPVSDTIPPQAGEVRS